MVWLDSTAWTFHEGVYGGNVGVQNITWQVSVPAGNYTINVQTTPASVGFAWCQTDRELLQGRPPWVVDYAPSNLTCLPAQTTAGVLIPTVTPVNVWPVKPRVYPSFDVTIMASIIIALSAVFAVVYAVGERY